jgi:serine/threonine-protein kinase
MTDDEREQQLAEAFAGLLDEKSNRKIPTELAGEWQALAEIDRVIDPAALPERLSGHRIVAEIGSGGMGRVLLAVDEALGRKVAIKTLAPRYAGDPLLEARFMAEARAMARVSHPNIVRIYNLGPADEPPHFVMEYLDGAPLTQAAAALTFEQRAELMRKVVMAAEFLHQRGIVHRDLKPGNILVSPDLEPKLLDFGLALDLGVAERLSKIGEVAGTPEYLSPEQTRGAERLDARSDVFSLGAILYELLTGAPPFRAGNVTDLVRRIREEEPALPRRGDPSIPRDLQNICLKALEKEPGRRYASAREMADDLRRFLAQEAVLAEPGAYSRLIAGQVGEHLRDLENWRRDQIVSDAEYDGIRKRYERLTEREDAWILEVRRLTLPQVTLYFGAWMLAVGAALLTFFPYVKLAGAPAVLTAWAAAVPTAWMGVRTWRRGYFRVAIAYLLAFCLVAPVAVLVTLEEMHLFTALTQGQVRLELFHRLEFAKQATNAQLWWSLVAGLPVCWWLRRFTRAPVFSLMYAAMTTLLCLATLLRLGVLDCLDRDPGRFYFDLIPCAVLFMAAGSAFERRRMPDDSRYFYPFAVAFTWAALSGVAVYHEPWARWLKTAAPWTRGQIEYLFILNACVYFVVDRICERFSSAQVRMVGKSFRFVIPGHVMTSLLLLGLGAESVFEARVFEWLLPAAACVFVFASIPRQMKNFLVSGLVFLAIGVYRLQEEVFPNRAFWPILLLAAGLGLMLAAANYAALRVALGRWWKTRSGKPGKDRPHGTRSFPL